MSQIVRDLTVEFGSVIPFRHPVVSLARRGINRVCWWSAPLCVLASLLPCKVHAQAPAPATPAAIPGQSAPCLPDGTGYLRARLKGSINADLDWGNDTTECTGAVRPTDQGIRMRFTHTAGADENGHGERLVLVFGIANLREGATARALPVNVTVIREGSGEFYGTQGDDKCTLDTVTQTPLIGVPHRLRVYRVVARGFCTEPARAIQGKGSVLISRFDYAGRVDFEAEDSADETTVQIPDRGQEDAR
jgi:hypothetical protein